MFNECEDDDELEGESFDAAAYEHAPQNARETSTRYRRDAAPPSTLDWQCVTSAVG
jgi:hypothetical protein